MYILFIVFLFISLLILAPMTLKIIRPFEKGVIERLGKYQRTVSSGLKLIVPFIEKMTKVDLRENVVDVPPQEVITKDNVLVTVDAVIYYEVTDAFKVLYNVKNFWIAVTKLAQTNLRNIVGDMTLDQTLTSRETINTRLREILDEATDKWGTRVTRVEIQRIDPPADVVEAMHRQMKAERDKRAAILVAEGEKMSRINRAEGEKQSQILKAEGEAAAMERVADAEKYKRLTIAKGEAEAIQLVFDAIHSGRPTNDLIAIKYLEALEKIADGNATKIFLPLETSGILGSIGAIGEIFKEKAVDGDTSKNVIPPQKK
ncbi:MAG: SPFH/Band 7/PHB domain protein [bacterium]|nr:SPFH/Band 7/PHB domain protein [bacterium]